MSTDIAMYPDASILRTIRFYVFRNFSAISQNKNTRPGMNFLIMEELEQQRQEFLHLGT